MNEFEAPSSHSGGLRQRSRAGEDAISLFAFVDPPGVTNRPLPEYVSEQQLTSHRVGVIAESNPMFAR